MSDTDEEHKEGIDDIAVGVSFNYRIPHFPVITLKLRQITFEAVLTDNERVITYDGFI